MTDTLIKVENVSKKFCRSLKKSLWYGMKDLGSELIGRSHGGNDDLRPDEFWAVKDVSFELKRGECLGLIGRNGAGKTTLLKMLNGLIKPDRGRIEMSGRVGALIALGAGFNPILTGRENIYVNASVLGLKKKEIDAKFDEIVEFAELGDFIDAPVQSYSSGMQVRLGFAVAIHLKPDILLVDEVLAVGDSGFKIKCYNKLFKIRDQTAIIFVSHSMPQIGKVCTSGMVMQAGKTIQTKSHLFQSVQTYYNQFDNAIFSIEGTQRVEVDRLCIQQDDTFSCYEKPWSDTISFLDINPNKTLTLEVDLNISHEVKKIVALWSINDIDQTLVGQIVSDTLDVQDFSSKHRIRTTINSLNLNTGKYTLTLHLFDSEHGGWDLILLGLRNFITMTVRKETYLGAAPIIYKIKSSINALDG